MITGGKQPHDAGKYRRHPGRSRYAGFRPFQGGKPNGAAEDILTGFLSPTGEARGRPVGVAIDGRGALLVADDVGNVIWRVVPSAGSSVALVRSR